MSIEVRGVTKTFGSFTAVNDVSLKVPDGELVALLGPSGSGKTSLLRIIAGLERPDRGQVLFEGQDATRRDARDRRVGLRLPALRALPAHERLRERGLRPARPAPRDAPRGGGDPREGDEPPAHGPARLALGPPALAALRRPAPAGRPRPRPRGRAAGAAPRRALRLARRQGPPGAAPLAAAAARRDPPHQRLRDPRPGGGARGGGPGRGHEPGPRRAGRLAGGDLRPAGDAVRHPLHGQRERLPRPGPERQGPPRPARPRLPGAPARRGAGRRGLHPALRPRRRAHRRGRGRPLGHAAPRDARRGRWCGSSSRARTGPSCRSRSRGTATRRSGRSSASGCTSGPDRSASSSTRPPRPPRRGDTTRGLFYDRSEAGARLAGRHRTHEARARLAPEEPRCRAVPSRTS